MTRYWKLVIVIPFIVQLYFLTHLQFTAWPEMFIYPYLRNHGFLLYHDMIHPYPPLLTMVLSFVYKLFGYQLIVLESVAWATIILTSLVLYLTLKLLTRDKGLSFIGLSVYVLTQPFLEGNMLWFDIAIVPLILLGLYFLIKSDQNRKISSIFFTGLFLCLAALVKQNCGLYIIAALVFLAYRNFSVKQLLIFLLPPLLLGVLLLLRLLQEKALTDFVNWTFLYPLTYWSKFPGYVQMKIGGRDLFVIALLVVPTLLIFTNLKNLKDTKVQLIILFLVLSLIGVYPRFSFFHFQTALTLFVVIGIYLARNIKIKKVVLASLLLIMLFDTAVYKEAIMFSWGKEARFYSQSDKETAQIIAGKTKLDDKIFLFGMPGQLYVLTDRIPPKRWADNFGWYLEIPGVQAEILTRWRENPPKYVFWEHPHPGNWFDLGTYQPREIAGFIETNYTKLEEVEKGVELWQKKEN